MGHSNLVVYVIESLEELIRQLAIAQWHGGYLVREALTSLQIVATAPSSLANILDARRISSSEMP